MTIEINEIEYCKLAVHYEAEPDNVSKKMGEIINKFKSYRVPGFRTGKATTDIIKVVFKKQIADTLKQELADEAVQNVIFEKNIKPFGNPSFTFAELDGNKFSCDFSLLKQPDFELSQYKSFEIPKPPNTVTVEEFSQRIIQDLRVKNGETTAYGENDFIQLGDHVIINYHATVDNQPIERLTATGEVVKVGQTPIPTFDDNLLGMKIGEEREFFIKIPENSKDPLSGKDVKFYVSITMGSKVIPAPLNDDLAKKIGLDSFDLLMQRVSTTSSDRIKELDKAHIMDQISRRLVDNHEFKVPEWLSLAEAKMNAKNAGEAWEGVPDEQKEKYISYAANSIKLSLILGKVRDAEPDAQLTDEEVFDTAKQNVAKFSAEPQKVLENLFSNGQLFILFNRIRDEHTLSFIEKNSTIVE